jgi:hypothetical protein
MKSFATLCTTLAATSALAQVQHGGAPVLSAVAPTQITLLPTPDVAALLAEDNNATKAIPTDPLAKAKPFRMGALLDITTDLSGFERTTSTDGETFRLAVRSAEAFGMGVNFKTWAMPEGCKMFVYNADASQQYGSFTTENQKEYGGFSVMPVKGDTVVIEVFVPSGAATPTVELESVVHHYKNTLFATKEEKEGLGCYGCSGSCNLNIACETGVDWSEQIDSVTAILTSSGSALCSGALINNALDDGRQLYLSADHCGGGNAEDWIFVFNYQTPKCDSGPGAPAKDQSVQGSKLLARAARSDFVLLELAESVPAAYNATLAGYNAVQENTFDKPFSISHPSGDVKKIATYDGPTITDGYFNPGTTHWYVAQWDRGMTEGGSSGSPLFDQQKRIRGQLHGGYATCSYKYSDYYGKLTESWDHYPGVTEQLAEHLDPEKGDIRVVDSSGLNEARARQAARVAAKNN